MKKPLVWLLGAVGAYWLISRTVRAAYNITYSIAGFSFTQVAGNNFVVNIRMTNNSDATIPLLGARVGGNITVNNSVYLGTAQGQLDMLLPARASVVVPVYMNVAPDYISGGVVALMTLLNKTGVSLTFNGALTVAGVSQPVAIEYKLL